MKQGCKIDRDVALYNVCGAASLNPLCNVAVFINGLLHNVVQLRIAGTHYFQVVIEFLFPMVDAVGTHICSPSLNVSNHAERRITGNNMERHFLFVDKQAVATGINEFGEVAERIAIIAYVAEPRPKHGPVTCLNFLRFSDKERIVRVESIIIKCILFHCVLLF
jgi:hypothetical protein